jgi:hypothetical protein
MYDPTQAPPEEPAQLKRPTSSPQIDIVADPSLASMKF